MSRIVVVGAGAVGGVIAAGLHEYDHNVAVVARGPHLAEVQLGGLTRDAPDGRRTFAIPAFASVADARITDDDLVIVSTKTPQAEHVLDQILLVAGPEVTVACATNGVETERLALRRFRNTLAILVNVPAVHLVPGIVETYANEPRGLLDVGPPDTPDSGPTMDRANKLSAALASAGFVSEATPRIMARKWAKLLGNTGNIVQVLCGPEDEDARGVADRLRDEAVQVVEAAGIAVDLETQQERAGLVARAPLPNRPRPGGSTWQSATRGTGSLETIALNGEIVLRAHLAGRTAPMNERMVQLAAQFMDGQFAIGSWTVPALHADLDRVRAKAGMDHP